jgi:hypothetical protein
MMSAEHASSAGGHSSFHQMVRPARLAVLHVAHRGAGEQRLPCQSRQSGLGLRKEDKIARDAA